MKYLEMEMADETSMIDFYTQRIEENRAVLESVTPQYDRAMAAKPSRPSGLGNVLSLGSSGKKYNREIYEWNQNCRPVIDRYKEVQIDIKLDTDELRQHKDSFEKNRIEYRKLKSRLSGINAAILKAVSVDRSVQMSLLPHVESMIRLLRLARQIAESRLDKKLTSKVSVGDISMDLPEDVSKNISTFIDAFNEGITAYTACSNDQEEEIVTRAENDAVQGVMNLVKECMKLNLMERQSVVVGEEYDRALGDLQASFKKYLPVLDMQADGLLEILRKINTAENHDDLMKGLLSLAGDDSSVFQGSDWTEFLKGNKTIEL